MSAPPAVDDILDRIRRLSDDDRDVLQRELDEEREAEWQRMAAEARLDAKRRGIDQAAIDRACEEVRYGEGAA